MTDTLHAVIVATIACGTLDAAAATTQAALLGIPAQRVWQTVASGLLGPRALEQGWRTGALGIALHFIISFTIATIYVFGSHRLPFLLTHPLTAGALYGIAVFVVMNFVVLPLSRRPKRPFNRHFALTQLVIHICIVGWSIAISAHYLLPRAVH